MLIKANRSLTTYYSLLVFCLGKVAVLRNAIGKAARLAAVGCAQLPLTSRSSHDTARMAHGKLCCMLAAELVGCVTLERCLVKEESLVLPTHCDVVAGSMLALAEKGLWRRCVPCLAALVGGVEGRYVGLTDQLSEREQRVYALDWAQYLAHVEHGTPLNPRTVSRNPFAMRTDEEAAQETGVSSGRWRMQREKKQRRWAGQQH